MGLFVPLYSWPNLAQPTSDWHKVAAAAAKVPTTAVINPSNGPIVPAPQAFVDGVALLHAAGVRVLGYVATGFGRKPLTTAVQEVDAYLAYPVDGIFFDEVATTSTSIAYYQALCSHAKAIGLGAVLNPGTSFPNALLDPYSGCDAAVVFENTEQAWAGYALSPENARLAPSQRIALIHSAVPDPARLQADLLHAQALRIQAVLVTDQPNWNRLPSYWAQEVAIIATMRLF